MSFDRSEIDELLADIRQATTSARDVAAEHEAEREQFREDSREFEEERAEAARKGELGRDWQVLQERIDRGETTVGQILDGGDTSPEAQRIQELAAKNLVRLTHSVHESQDESDDDGVSELTDAFASLRESIDRAGQSVRDVRGYQGGERSE